MTIDQIGVIGGGQLAWMLGEAAAALGLGLIVQTPHLSDPAVTLAQDVVLGAIDDLAVTQALSQRCQVITFENEFVDLPGLETLAQEGVCFRPSLKALAPLLDKYEQRQFLQELGLPVPPCVTADRLDVHSPTLTEDLAQLGFGFPLVIKSRRHGYDGQGTFVIETLGAWEQFWAKALSPHHFLLEAYVPFVCELAIMAARSVSGEMALYPLAETQQSQQVCRRVIVPASVSPEIMTQAQAMAQTLLTQLEFVGILGIEFFLTANNQLLINEIAPRTHNSGHYTIEACPTSQFAQHLLAISGRGLGDVTLQYPAAVMVNLLGFETATSDYLDKRNQLAATPQAHVHWYGKTQSYPGRKLGHVTVLLQDNQPQHIQLTLRDIDKIWYQ